jgi:DNA topoisomerase-3
MKLIIAEKNVLARDIAKALCGKKVTDKTPLPISGNGYTVCALSGHVLELVEPEHYDPKYSLAHGTWDIDDLPIIFKNWKKDIKRATDDNGHKINKPDEYAKRKLDTVAALSKNADIIIGAGDPDDEGQCLVDEVIDYIGWHGPTKRVYVNDNIEKNIRKEFDQLKDNDSCRSDGLAAYARSMGDMVYGLNESRLISRRLYLHNVGLGRVQTPVLGMIVERDRAIENHISRNYYEISASIRSENNAISALTQFVPSKNFLETNCAGEKHIFKHEIIQAEEDKISCLKNLSFVVKNKQEKKNAPLPYNITELEADMNSRYGFKAAQTLAITQTLRDKYSAITYNRTSSSYLKEEHYKNAPVVLKCALKNISRTDLPLNFSLHSKCFNDSKVAAHHGIIPQEINIDCSSMSSDEQNVYTAIVERYAMQFLPPCIYAVCDGRGKFDDGYLHYKVKKVSDPGWTTYFKTKKDKSLSASSFFPDGSYRVNVNNTNIISKETTPPKRYTEASLLKDMASASKYVKDTRLKAALKKKDEDDPDENGGIGTSATRPNIIERLKHHEFIKDEGKNIVSTARGRAVYDLVPNDTKGVDMTARWWLICEDIRNKKKDVNALPQAVADVFRAHKDTAYKNVKVPDVLQASGQKQIGTCPLCGSPVLTKKNSYSCASNHYSKDKDGNWHKNSGCGFIMRKQIAHKAITPHQAQNLLNGKKVKMSGLKKKSGGTFEAFVSLCPDKTGNLEFSFDGLGRNKKKKTDPWKKK